MFDIGEDAEKVELGDAITQLEAALGAFTRVDLSAVSSGELTAALRKLEVSAARHSTVQRHLVADIDQRGLAAEYCAGTTGNLLRDLLLITSADAGARVAQARDFAPRRSLTGEPLEPVIPLVAEAVDSGVLSLAHAKVIAKLLTELPATVEREFGTVVQEVLIKQSAHLNPTQLAQVAIRLRDTLDPDGKHSTEQDHQRRRQFSLLIHADGSSKPSGHFTAELTTALRPVIDSLSAPRNTDDQRDERTGGQRRHDALLDMAMRLLRSGTLPESGGAPVTILLTMTEEQAAAHLAGGNGGLVEDGYGSMLTLGRALRLAAEAAIVPVALTATGGIMSYGRTLRLATTAQRRALATRDRGCGFPGCTVHSAWAEVHHIVEWLMGGNTDISNLVLLCPYHHRHFEAAGWQVRMSTEDQVPEWIPPAWLDPDRRPKRNTARHHAAAELVRTTTGAATD
jgi:hypothetical protein